MKKLLSVIALLLVSVIAMAQKGYDSEHKYDLFSNLEIGISGQYSYALSGKTGNWGADIRMTKRLGDHWRLRGIADFNGFGVKKGFDRYAKAMAGMSVDFLPFYIFADYGVSYNPSAYQKFNPAGDAGIGLHFDIGRGLRFYTEAGADRTANGNNEWHSDAFVKVGYAYNLGITENDRKEIDIDRHVHSEYGELKQENQLLKSEAQKITQANEQLQSTLERATLLCEQLEKKLTDCNEATRQAELNCQSALPPIYFEYASSYLTSIEEEKVAMIASTIAQDDAGYMIEGYCSANGDPYKNQILSEERARAVYFALVGYGVEPSRLFIVGNGMTDNDYALDQKVVVKKSY